MRKMTLKSAKVLASLALGVTTMTANSTCVFITHQPKMPEGAKKLRKF